MSSANINDARKKIANALVSLNKLGGDDKNWIRATKGHMKNTLGKLNKVAAFEKTPLARNNSAMQQPMAQMQPPPLPPKPEPMAQTQPPMSHPVTKMFVKRNIFGKTRYFTPSANGRGYTQVRKNYAYNKNIRTAPARAARTTYRSLKNRSRNTGASISSGFSRLGAYLQNSVAQRANRIAKAAANAAAKSAAARNLAHARANQVRMRRNANAKAAANRRALANAQRF
jgi:hypothetical protein